MRKSTNLSNTVLNPSTKSRFVLTPIPDIADLSSIFYLGSGPSENPMFHYVLPLISTIPPIRYALAGSASCHIAARTSDEALERKSLRLRVHATYLLREMLQTPGGVSDQNVLASILMLAQLDVSDDIKRFG